MELQVIKELLKEGGSLKVLVRGNSMRPYLIHERDYVVLRKLDSVKVGDIVLAEVTPGYFVLHRLVNIEGDKITLRGDGNVKTEHGKLGDVCGTVVGFYRKGGQALEKPDTLKYKIFTFLWTHTLPWRSFMLRVHHLFFESCKDLKRITPSENDVEAFLQLLRHALWGTEIKQDFHGVCWEAICQLATEQTVQGLIADAINHLPNDARPKGKEAFRLINTTFNLMYTHQRLNADIVKVFTFLKENHFTPILFKGQGNATFYPNPQLRQCGDIDVWVEGGRKQILNFLKEKGFKVSGVVYHHCEVRIFDDVKVEVHFLPSFMNSPILNARLQKFFSSCRDGQFGNHLPEHGFNVPQTAVATIHSVVHVFRHLFHEGIGLRQIIDLYYLLKALTGEEKAYVMGVLDSLKLSNFTAALMWVLYHVLGLDEKYLLCPTDEKKGARLYSEILKSGNFGLHDPEFKRYQSSSPFVRAWSKINRLFGFMGFCPSEVLWAPAFKLGQYIWIKANKYQS